MAGLDTTWARETPYYRVIITVLQNNGSLKGKFKCTGPEFKPIDFSNALDSIILALL